MATRERCEQELRRKLKSRDDVKAFRAEFGGNVVTNQEWDEARFVGENIRKLVEEAHRGGLLDKLGVALSLPTDAEAMRIQARRAAWRAWIAILVSVLALLISMYAACRPHRPLNAAAPGVYSGSSGHGAGGSSIGPKRSSCTLSDVLGISLGPYRTQGIDCPNGRVKLGNYPEYPCPIEVEERSRGFLASHHRPHWQQRVLVLCARHDARAVMQNYVDVIDLCDLVGLLRAVA